jgi:hypothetical protein
MSAIDLDSERDEDRALWNSVGELTALLPADWTLIGGLMVQLPAIERGITDARVTTDIDPPPTLVGNVSAVGIPGGSQALARTETVLVRLDGREFELRPTLLGAILIKPRSLAKHRDPDAQREDLLLLLSLVEAPRDLAAQMKRTERGWLRGAEERLRFDEPAAVTPDCRTPRATDIPSDGQVSDSGRARADGSERCDGPPARSHAHSFVERVSRRCPARRPALPGGRERRIVDGGLDQVRRAGDRDLVRVDRRGDEPRAILRPDQRRRGCAAGDGTPSPLAAVRPEAVLGWRVGIGCGARPRRYAAAAAACSAQSR